MALTQTIGLIALQFLTNEILPMNFTEYSQSLSEFIKQTEFLANQLKVNVNFNSVLNSLNYFNFAAKKLQSQIEEGPYSSDLNDKLKFAERFFIGPGLPLRPYYRHGYYYSFQ